MEFDDLVHIASDMTQNNSGQLNLVERLIELTLKYVDRLIYPMASWLTLVDMLSQIWKTFLYDILARRLVTLKDSKHQRAPFHRCSS